MKRIEYKTIQVYTKGTWSIRADYEKLEQDLNELGNQGWEVVTSTHSTFRDAKTTGTVIILKREKN